MRCGGSHGLRRRRLTRRAFWRRFGRLEHERLEFKASVNHVCESVVAMAMTSGGTILVGVSEGPVLSGCTVDQRALDRIADVAHETQVDLRVRRLEVAGTAIIAIEVPPVAPRVVTTTDGRMLQRVGASNRPLCGEGVLRFLAARPAAGARAGEPARRVRSIAASVRHLTSW
jgi:predicted HTH transcriptional regulator